MLITQSMIRNSPSQTFLYCLVVTSILCVFVLIRNYEIFCKVLDFRDLTCLFLLFFGIISVVTISSFIHLLLLFSFEYFVKGESQNIIDQFKCHLKDHGNLCFVLCLNIVGFSIGYLYLNEELKFYWDYIVILPASILFACMTILVDYDDADLYSSQNIEKSIGAFWASGAYFAFYKRILIDIPKRMSDFEEKNGIKFLVKKLVLICPRSCNANGTLEGKDGEMEVIGSLEEIIHDEGAANNRNLKTNVYKIRGISEAYIAAEIPSPLATLYEMRDIMDAVILEYHRNCFIKTFTDLTISENCEVVEYDDINSPEPLHSFLLSKFQNKIINMVK